MLKAGKVYRRGQFLYKLDWRRRVLSKSSTSMTWNRSPLTAATLEELLREGVVVECV